MPPAKGAGRKGYRTGSKQPVLQPEPPKVSINVPTKHGVLNFKMNEHIYARVINEMEIKLKGKYQGYALAVKAIRMKPCVALLGPEGNVVALWEVLGNGMISVAKQ